jgi:uncharacterized protein YjbI with pentapeptide repeats
MNIREAIRRATGRILALPLRFILSLTAVVAVAGVAIKLYGLAAVAVIASAMIITALLLSITILPRYVIRWDMGGSSGNPLTPAEFLAARNNARAALLQAVQTSGVLLVVIGAFLTWLQIQDSRNQLSFNRQAELAERYAKSLDHLASSDVNVRIGSLYTLRSVARESSDEREAVRDILISYVRQHSPMSPPLAGVSGAGGSAAQTRTLQLSATAADVQVALGILGGLALNPQGPTTLLQLSQLDLRGGAYSGLSLRQTDFSGATLIGVYLRNADLDGSLFVGTRISNAFLSGADLHGSDFSTADAEGVDLSNAVLRDARFQGADLKKSKLVGADLRGADLRNADLRNADLRNANLRSARLDGAKLEGTRLEGTDLGTASVAPPSVRITSPRDGVHVRTMLKVSGTAALRPQEQLWLAIYDPGEGLFFLAMDGPVPVVSHAWTAQGIVLGSPRDIGIPRTIVAIVTGSEGSASLRQLKPSSTGDLQLHSLPADARIADQVIVVATVP